MRFLIKLVDLQTYKFKVIKFSDGQIPLGKVIKKKLSFLATLRTQFPRDSYVVAGEHDIPCKSGELRSGLKISYYPFLSTYKMNLDCNLFHLRKLVNP